MKMKKKATSKMSNEGQGEKSHKYCNWKVWYVGSLMSSNQI
jgi:hypothetical protein